jgi:hypothetical protein
MRFALVVLGFLSGCASNPAPEKHETPTQKAEPTQPLVCNATEPCRPLPEEITAQCAKPNQTVEVGTCGAFEVLISQTDRESVTYTSEKRYYDASDKLVAIQLFVNEYGRDVTFGSIPRCALGSSTPACPPK